MLKLNSNTINELINILQPFLEHERQRHNCLTSAFGINAPILLRIVWDGSVIDFIPHLVSRLVEYSEITRGKQALFILLEYVSSIAGIDVQQRINNLISELKLEATSQTRLQSSIQHNLVDVDGLREARNIFSSPFFGQTEELQQLEQLIINGQNRLITFIGMSGIGKSRLAAKLIETKTVNQQFDYFIWKDLRIASSFEEFITSLLSFFSVKAEVTASPSTDRVTYLINYLENQKCLLVLDDLTEILDVSSDPKIYKEGWQDFDRFLEQVTLQPHKSLFIVTCHEIPQTLEEYRIKNNYANFKVRGLKLEEIQPFFQGLYTEDEAEYDRESLVDYYGGNPGVLEIAIKWINNQYDGNISRFLEDNFRHGNGQVIEEINALLNKHFERLNDSEKRVMFLLAIANESINFPEISAFIENNTHYFLRNLEDLSLIKKTSFEYYTQVPMVMDYVNNKIINNIVEEIVNYQENKKSFLNEYYLINSEAKDYIKDVQKRRIIQPIIQQLIIKLGRKFDIEERLKKILSDWQMKKTRVCYVGGNIINLLLELNVNLEEYDFSGIPIWQAELQGKELRKVDFTNCDLSRTNFYENLGCIHAIAFSHDGKYFATAEANGIVRLWETDSCKQIQLFNNEGSSSQIWSIAFSPDSTIIASAGEDKIIRLWNVRTGHQYNEIRDNQCVNSLAFHRNGNTLVSAGDGRIALWDVSTCRLHKEISTAKKIYSIAINRRNLLVSGSQDGTVILWDINDIKSPTLSHTWKEHKRAVRCVAFSPDGQTIASGSEDGTVRIWKIGSNPYFQILNTSEIKHIWTVAFSPDGKILASGSRDYNPIGIDECHNIRLWNINDGSCLKKLDAHKNTLRSIAFCPKSFNSTYLNLLISGADDHTIKVWNISSGKCHKTIQGYTNRIWSVAFSPCGKTLISGSEDNKIRIWNFQNKKCIQTTTEHTSWVWSVAFSSDGNMFASGSQDNTVRLWEFKNKEWQCKNILKRHTDRVRIVAFSPDGKRLASGGNDCQVILWNTTDGKVIKTLDESNNGHTYRILSLAFSKDGNIVASSSRDQTIRLWNLTTDVVDVLSGHDNQVHSIALSQDGNLLVSGGFDHKVKLWDLKNKEYLYSFEEHEDRILCVAFHPDSLVVASSGHDKTIRLWSTVNKKCIGILEGHRGAVESITFSPQGGIIVSSSQDQTIKIWDAFTSKCLGTIEPESKPYEGMRISGVQGLSAAQISTLISLGAVD